MNQSGHNHFVPRLASEINNRWEISLTHSGPQR